jgi:hypothetical protein
MIKAESGKKRIARQPISQISLFFRNPNKLINGKDRLLGRVLFHQRKEKRDNSNPPVTST